MSKPTAVLFCPGRGAYGKDELGFVGRTLRPGPVADALAASDAARRAADRATLTEVDAADRFRPSYHLDGENAAELIYFGAMAHVEQLRERYEIVAVAGNSLGWYTALPASGALDPTAGWRLVATMARLQKLVKGGQVLTTTVGDDWRRNPALWVAVEATVHALQDRGDEFYCDHSIHLGGHAVLAGTEAAVQELLVRLPKVKVGEREFPFRLAGHGPFHTRLCNETSAQAATLLADLPIKMPQCHLIDGFGNVHSPWSADPRDLLYYTTHEQVTETYDFSASVRTAMREFQPDVLLCAGPGNSLRAPVGHCVLAEGWRGVHDKQALFAAGLIATE
ncbi:MAG: ACP S-malonyltransferase [Planctomycetes bacterium]|nr:ACP S-malonyltransferase [Planctomycetota bacterium]MCB9884514.1 ACP S-malonyltransferase [Planctomycetota bacterium]